LIPTTEFWLAGLRIDALEVPFGETSRCQPAIVHGRLQLDDRRLARVALARRDHASDSISALRRFSKLRLDPVSRLHVL
jgi:hypothetical protein